METLNWIKLEEDATSEDFGERVAIKDRLLQWAKMESKAGKEIAYKNSGGQYMLKHKTEFEYDMLQPEDNYYGVGEMTGMGKSVLS
jgi:hypothetical protein